MFVLTFLAIWAIYAAPAANDSADKRFSAVRARLVSVTVHLQKGCIAIVLSFGFQVFFIESFPIAAAGAGWILLSHFLLQFLL